MSVKVKMHEYAPRQGYVLNRFRVDVPGQGYVTFEAGGIYDVDDEFAAYLLSVKSRPESTSGTVPLAFCRVDEGSAPAPKAPEKPKSMDLTTADLPKPTTRTRKPRLKPSKVE